MANPTADDDPEKPLDPAVVRVQERLQRMMLWSRGIMVVGFAALFGVMFYKFYWIRPTAPVSAASPLSASLPPMPDGGRVTETRLDGGRLLVTIESPKSATVLIIDPDSLQVLRRLEIPRGN